MRTALAAVVLVVATALATAQPKELEPRYGVTPKVKLYPQGTPKQALKTTLELIDKGEYAYLVAHLLDPKEMDERIAARAKLFEAAAEAELAKLRDFQRANPDSVTRENRVPQDPKEFRLMAAERARDRAFRQVAKDVQQKLANDPQALRDMRRLLREGMFADADAVSIASHPEIKGQTLHFKKIDDRWFLENHQAEEKKGSDQ
jgi:hypothetical protein